MHRNKWHRQIINLKNKFPYNLRQAKHDELMDDPDALFPSRHTCVLLRDECGPFKMIILSAKQLCACVCVHTWHNLSRW